MNDQISIFFVLGNQTILAFLDLQLSGLWSVELGGIHWQIISMVI